MALDPRADAWARIAACDVPQRALVALLRALGGPEQVLAASPAQLANLASPEVAARMRASLAGALIDATRAWLELQPDALLAWDDPDYPKALLDLGDAPPVLFYLGRRELLNRPALAIVGSRNATPQGVENARAFASALSQAGVTIVSGLALGIDAAAHAGALTGPGSTLACVGTGLDRVYPSRHRDLAHAIAVGGGLLTEFLPGTPPLKFNFPRRNRLISGLARGVLVVEATLSSGSLITARLAGEQGREVFAIPGSIHSPFSKGCHKLIREGAKLVETAADILDELRIPVATLAPPVDQPTGPVPHRAVVEALGSDPADLDALMARTHLTADAVAAALIELELDGHVAALPGGRWQRVA